MLINLIFYYLMVIELNVGIWVFENVLVFLMGESMVKLFSDVGSNIIYWIINDYGVFIFKMMGVME